MSKWGRRSQMNLHLQATSNQCSSRQSKDFVLGNAHQIYKSDAGVDFKLEYAWQELHHDPKWRSYTTSSKKTGGSSEKQRRINELGGYSSGSNLPIFHGSGDNSRLTHPLGVKASEIKAKYKKVVKDEPTSEDFLPLRLSYEQLAEMLPAFIARRQEKLNMKKMKEERKAKAEAKAKGDKMNEIKFQLLLDLVKKSEPLSSEEVGLKTTLIKFFTNNYTCL